MGEDEARVAGFHQQSLLTLARRGLERLNGRRRALS